MEAVSYSKTWSVCARIHGAASQKTIMYIVYAEKHVKSKQENDAKNLHRKKKQGGMVQKKKKESNLK
jgi:hypothetical protein